MTPDSTPSAPLDFALQVERLYSAMIRCADISSDTEPASEPSLGGKLFYVGELIPDGRALLVAGNIAGAASVAVSADGVAQKQAVRDGAADFLVNSLDEALRILKNEIRKRETVAVCIAAAPDGLEREMLERGVLPDLLPPLFASSQSSFGDGSRRIQPFPAPSSDVLLAWEVAAAPAQWLPRLDAMALDCLGENQSAESSATRRWLRLAPRYLGRMAKGVRVLRSQADVAAAFVARVRSAMDGGELGVRVKISLNGKDDVCFAPQSDGPTH